MYSMKRVAPRGSMDLLCAESKDSHRESGAAFIPGTRRCSSARGPPVEAPNNTRRPSRWGAPACGEAGGAPGPDPACVIVGMTAGADPMVGLGTDGRGRPMPGEVAM